MNAKLPPLGSTVTDDTGLVWRLVEVIHLGPEREFLIATTSGQYFRLEFVKTQPFMDDWR